MAQFQTLHYKPMGAYKELTASEAEKFNIVVNKDTIALCNKKRGSVIAVAHKKLGLLSGALADNKAMCDKLKQSYQKQYPELCDIEDFEMNLVGKTRYGFKFRFPAGRGNYYSEVISVTENKHCYTISSSSPYKERAQMHTAYTAFLKSITFEE